MPLMPEDDELEDPRRTENRGWPAPGGPGAGKSTTDEELREAYRRAREEVERRERDRDEG
jgi:hypothetical protein